MSIRSISRPQGLGRSFTAGTALRGKGSFDYGTNPFTFSARIFRPSATSGSHAILSFGREDDAYAVMRLLDNALAVECGLDFSVSYPAVAASSPIPYGRWCTVSAVFDATEIRIYVDGVSAGSVGLTRNDTR